MGLPSVRVSVMAEAAPTGAVGGAASGVASSANPPHAADAVGVQHPPGSLRLAGAYTGVKSGRRVHQLLSCRSRSSLLVAVDPVAGMQDPFQSKPIRWARRFPAHHSTTRRCRCQIRSAPAADAESPCTSTAPPQRSKPMPCASPRRACRPDVGEHRLQQGYVAEQAEQVRSRCSRSGRRIHRDREAPVGQWSPVESGRLHAHQPSRWLAEDRVEVWSAGSRAGSCPSRPGPAGTARWRARPAPRAGARTAWPRWHGRRRCNRPRAVPRCRWRTPGPCPCRCAGSRRGAVRWTWRSPLGRRAWDTTGRISRRGRNRIANVASHGRERAPFVRTTPGGRAK